jgi:2-dehydropantoate 2-reductase
MRLCIYGAGAIGGYLGAMLARRNDVEVSLVARGAHLAAIQDRGLTLKTGGEVFTVHPVASDEPAKLGRQDYVILTLKAHGLSEAAENIRPLLGPDTSIIFGQNGLPWWYFYRHGGPHEGQRLKSVDPDGRIWENFGPERAIGTVIWQAADLEAPGIIRHQYGDRMPLGEPDGSQSSRAEALSRILVAAGIKSPVRPKIRNEIWLKLWGNLSFNPLSVLTQQTLEGMARDPGVTAVVRAMMEEARTIAETLGITFLVSAEQRIEMAAKVGAHRTSMLQDLKSGRRTELDALLGSVVELAEITNLPAPICRMIYDLTRARIAAQA